MRAERGLPYHVTSKYSDRTGLAGVTAGAGFAGGGGSGIDAAGGGR
jgi:hypothetical protein